MKSLKWSPGHPSYLFFAVLTLQGTCSLSLSLLPTRRCQTVMSHVGCCHKFRFKPMIPTDTHTQTYTHRQMQRQTHTERHAPGKCCMNKYIWQTPIERVCMCVHAHVFLCFWIKCLNTDGHTRSSIYGFQHLAVKYVWPSNPPETL